MFQTKTFLNNFIKYFLKTWLNIFLIIWIDLFIGNYFFLFVHIILKNGILGLFKSKNLKTMSVINKVIRNKNINVTILGYNWLLNIFANFFL